MLHSKKETKLDNIDLNQAWANSKAIVDRIKASSPDELQDAYRNIDIRVGLKDGKPLASLQWKSWKLQICTFDPKPITEVGALNVQVQDQVFIDLHDAIVTRSSQDEKLPDNLRLAYVYEILDAFLDGSWTPPWKCGYCRDRIKGLVKPQW
jgi:hypothetical protein